VNFTESKLHHDHGYHVYHGLYIIDLHRRGGEYMFRILDVSTEKCLYCWNITELLICDNIGYMVYLEIHHAGLLWMHSANASEISEYIQK